MNYFFVQSQNICCFLFQFYRPDEALVKYLNKEMQLFPPQLYELTRLAHHNDIDNLRDFFVNRQSKGVSQFFCQTLSVALYSVVHIGPLEFRGYLRATLT
jgi:hypothetical protein